MTSGIEISRPFGQRCTVVIIPDLYLQERGFQPSSSPEIVVPSAILVSAFDRATAAYQEATHSAHIWAAESKRKLTMKKFPFLHYTKPNV